MACSLPKVSTSSRAKSLRRKNTSRASTTREKRMISALTLEKLATKVDSRLSYSLGSITRVRVDWMLPKKEVSTVPMSSTYSTL